MTQPFLIGDTQDYHSAWLNNGIFHCADLTDNQLIKTRLLEKQRSSDQNFVYYDENYVVTVMKIQLRDKTLFEASDSEICLFSKGYYCLQNGQLLNPENQTIYKFSDFPCQLLVYQTTVLAASMSGEFCYFLNDKLVQKAKFPSRCRGMLRYQALCCNYFIYNAYIVTETGIRMQSQPENVVAQLQYASIRRVDEQQGAFAGIGDGRIDVFEISSDCAIHVVASKQFKGVRFIDAVVTRKQGFYALYYIYEDTDDSFKYAAYAELAFVQQTVQPPAELKAVPQKHERIDEKITEKLPLIHDNPVASKATVQPSEQLDNLTDSSGLSGENNEPVQDPRSGLASELSSSLTSQIGELQAELQAAEGAAHERRQEQYLQQFFTADGESNTISSFVSPQEKLRRIRESPITIFCFNQYGQILGFPAGQQFQLTIKSAEKPATMQFPVMVAHADLWDGYFAVLLSSHIIMQKIDEKIPLFKVLFSPFLTPYIIKIVDAKTLCAVFQSNRYTQLLVVYQNGVPVLQRTFQRVAALTSFNKALYVLADEQFFSIDTCSLKTLYTCQLRYSSVQFFQANAGGVFLATNGDIYQIDFEDSFQTACGASLVFSSLEQQYARINEIQQRILKVVLQKKKEQISRADIEQMAPFICVPIYCDCVDGAVEFQCLEVYQQNCQVLQTIEKLLQIANGAQLQLDYEHQFESDLDELKESLPDTIQPQFELNENPLLQMVRLSPPVNNNSDEIDAMERTFFLELLQLKQAYLSQHTEEADIKFDIVLIQYAKLLAENQLFQRLEIMPYFCRTRSALEGLRSLCANCGAFQAAEVCLELAEARFAEEAYAKDSEILPTIVIGEEGQFVRRLDDLGYSFASGDAKQRFQEAIKEGMARIDDIVKKGLSVQQQGKKKGASRVGAAEVAEIAEVAENTAKTVTSAARQQENYQQYQKASPKVNLEFLARLGHKSSPAEKKVEASKVKPAVQSGTPMKNQMSLGDALGGSQ